MACEKIRTQDISYEMSSKSFGNHFKKLVPLQNSWEIIVFSLQSFNSFFYKKYDFPQLWEWNQYLKTFIM